MVKQLNTNEELSDSKSLTDEVLAKRYVQSQDEEIFSEIVNRYSDKIYRLALRIINNTSDADDILQKVFITLIEKLDSFQGESKFSTWLYRIVSNACFMHLRSEMKFKNYITLEDQISVSGNGITAHAYGSELSYRPEDLLLSKEVMEIIKNAVNEMPEAYSDVFHLRDIEGLTNQEVAKLLGLSLPSVKSRIHRARYILRDKLSACFPEYVENNSYPFTLYSF